MSELSEFSKALDEGIFEPTFKRSQDVDQEPDTTTVKEWQAIRDECEGGGSLDERCDIIAQSTGVRKMEVVAKRLACGCILVPADADDIVL